MPKSITREQINQEARRMLEGRSMPQLLNDWDTLDAMPINEDVAIGRGWLMDDGRGSPMRIGEPFIVALFPNRQKQSCSHGGSGVHQIIPDARIPRAFSPKRRAHTDGTEVTEDRPVSCSSVSSVPSV